MFAIQRLNNRFEKKTDQKIPSIDNHGWNGQVLEWRRECVCYLRQHK